MKNCKLAEIGLETDTLGNIKTCCVAPPLLTEEGTPYNISTHSIFDAWNSESRKKIISDLKSGIEASNCETCWQEERAELISKRIRDNIRYSDTTLDKQPKMLDLKPSNTCNLRCRTCYSGNSSSWTAEEYDLNLRTNKVIINPYKNNSKYWEDIRSVIQGIEYLEFYGGEPLLIDNLWEILDSIDLSNLEIHINSNCSMFLSVKQLDILNRCKHCRIVLSIDGINDKFEYLRYPAKWESVLQNIAKYHELISSKFQVTVCCTISNINLLYVDELVHFFEQEFPNMRIFLNYLFYPKKFKITSLPQEVKEYVRSKIRTSEIISFLFTEESDLNAFKEFEKTIVLHDKYRKQSFSETFPEWEKILGIYS